MKLKACLTAILFILLSFNGYAQPGDAARPAKNNTITDIDSRLKKLENNFEIEQCAAKKLVEISEKNLSAPNWILAIIITFLMFSLGSAGGIVGYIIRVKKDVNKSIDKKFEHLIKQIEDIDKDRLRLLAHDFINSSVKAWQRNSFDSAIEKGEKAISYLKRYLEYDTTNDIEKNALKRFKSNLAYYYVDAGKTDKTGLAIEYAKEGLQIGRKIDDIEYIDNYLFVIMNYDHMQNERSIWTKTYEVYKDRLKKTRDRNEQEKYESYYRKLKKQKTHRL